MNRERSARPLLSVRGLVKHFPLRGRLKVRAVDGADLESCGVQGLVVNAFHLARRPGSRARGLG